MSRLQTLILVFSVCMSGSVAMTVPLFLASDFSEWLNPRLATLRAAAKRSQSEREFLGPVALRQTSIEVGYQSAMVSTPPPELSWVQLDLLDVHQIDSITLIPAILGLVPTNQTAYAFPPRFRVDASNDVNFARFQRMFDTGEEDIDLVGGLPLVIDTPGLKARYLRITVSRLAKVASMWSFALGEIMVLEGNRNIAIGGRVTTSSGGYHPPYWRKEYLVDGRTPFGPPIEIELTEFDGLYSRPQSLTDHNWMMVDLGSVVRVDEVRLHPVHARIGYDIPGNAFPVRFKLEASVDESFTNAISIHDDGERAFSNPGNNPVYLPTTGIDARYVRVVCLESTDPEKGFFGLSEIQIYSGNTNVARKGAVSVSGDTKERPPEMLIDNYTSFGELVELPQWIERWRRCRELTLELQNLDMQMEPSIALARRRGYWIIAATLMGIMLTVIVNMLWMNRKRRLELRTFRMRMARDLHDEIGSNLAAISLLSEVAGVEKVPRRSSADWNSVRQMATECIHAMHETLWLLGGRQQPDGDLLDRLKQTATRMLPSITIHWTVNGDSAVDSSNDQLHRELLLAFKEIIANIAKHSRATQVNVVACVSNGTLTLDIQDNGVGISGHASRSGIGLSSIRRRIEGLGGFFSVTSQKHRGTQIKIRLRFKTSNKR